LIAKFAIKYPELNRDKTSLPDVDADTSAPRFQALLKANPSGRLGTADDIAAVVDLLVSEPGGFINGQMLQVNGGVINQV